MKNKKIEMCLCGVCARNFYNTPGHQIKRKDPLQITKDVCTYCNCRMGYDYLVSDNYADKNRIVDGKGEDE